MIKLYTELLSRALHHPEAVVSPRGQLTHELLNVQLGINPSTHVLRTNTQYDEQMQEYARKEHAGYLSGEMSATYWERVAKLWGTIKNPDGTINSNYGNIVFHDQSCADGGTQWQWAKRSLQQDADTRQAVMHFNQPKHQWAGNKDFPCTIAYQFMLRRKKLHATVWMRSQDLIFGFPYDIAWFSYLLVQMSQELDVPAGRLTHIVTSLHLYARNFDRAKEIVSANR